MSYSFDIVLKYRLLDCDMHSRISSLGKKTVVNESILSCIFLGITKSIHITAWLAQLPDYQRELWIPNNEGQ